MKRVLSLRHTRHMTRAVLLFCLILSVAASVAGRAMAFDTNIRCMSDCVILEGETQRDVCKQRCAGIDPMNMPKQKDCGTIYKQCVNACATDVGCKSECRQAKQSCI